MDTDKIIENLESSNRKDKQRQLEDLIRNCEEYKCNVLEEIYNDICLKILECYSDRFESIRELACQAITEFIKKLPSTEITLSWIIRAIKYRIGEKELKEESEEMRLMYIQQLNFIIKKNKSHKNVDLLLQSYDEIIEIFLKTLTDPYPAVQKEACMCIESLASSTPSFHYRAEVLTHALYPMLHHKFSANRIAAIEALGLVCLHIRTNTDCIKEIIIEVTPLAMDPMPLVRKACGKVGCMWLLKLKDRYSFFDRILPIVLCGMGDETPEVKEEIEKLWYDCGEQYFVENELELSQVALVDNIPRNYPRNIKRPTLGCRALVQKSLGFIKSIMNETYDWKEEVRLSSLKLLWQVILHAETAISSMFMDIYPDLCAVCKDSDVNVSKLATNISELLGKFVDFNDWCELASEYLENNPKLENLKCFYFLYLGSNDSNKNNILKIVKILAKNEFSSSLNCQIQNIMLKFVEILWERYQQVLLQSNEIEEAMKRLQIEDDEVEKVIYFILIKITAISIQTDTELHDKAKSLLKEVSKQNELCMHRKYLNDVIESFDNLNAELNHCTEPILTLSGIIRVCGFHKNYLQTIKKCISDVFEYGTTDAKVKILSSISIAMLTWSLTILDEFDVNESTKLLQEFIADIIQPYLTWKPGASAESLRSLATTTLCSITQGARFEAPKILPKLVHEFENLLDDNFVTTRIYALRCFNNFGTVESMQLKQLGYKILSLIDDSCAEVRETAVFTLTKLKTEQDQSQEWREFIKSALKLLFIHLDNPEIQLTKIIKVTIITLGKEYLDEFSETFEIALHSQPNIKHELMEIEKEIKK